MKTCGMMGEVIGKAASLCRRHECSPRQVYQQYWDEMDKLLHLPGQARRATVQDEIVVPEGVADVPPGAQWLKLPGIAVDDSMAKSKGVWKNGQKLKGYHGDGYQYAAPRSDSQMRFLFYGKETGRYDVRISWRPHENRATNAKVEMVAGGKSEIVAVDMQKTPELESSFHSIGKVELEKRARCEIIFDASDADGVVCVDAVQLVRVK